MIESVTASGPECPDPAQLTLFEAGSREIDAITDSLSNDQTVLPDNLHNRSPTFSADQTQSKSVFNKEQQVLASSLHRKSRELVKKSIENKYEPDDILKHEQS